MPLARTKTSQCVDTIDVHGTAPANSFTTTSPESQGGIDLVLNANEGIQHHGASLVQV